MLGPRTTALADLLRRREFAGRKSEGYFPRPESCVSDGLTDINWPLTMPGERPFSKASITQGHLAWSDLVKAIRLSWLWAALGWLDIVQRYRGSLLGPFWLTITSAAFIAGLGPLYAQLFNQKMATYLPYLAYGITIWNYISGTINESCSTFINARDTMKQIQMPRLALLFQVIWRNVIVFLHNLPIFVVVIVAFGPAPRLETAMVIPGFVLTTLNLIWIGLVLAILCLRFRDVTPIVGAVLQMSFFLTPVMWHYDGRNVSQLFVELNPFAAWVNSIRAPLLGQSLDPWSIIMSIVCLVVGYGTAGLLFIRYRRRLVYWL